MARELMKQKRADKSNHIIEIATEVFSEKGYHGALTDEIADRAGISKRSMYYYIGDKDMLYEAVIKNILDQVDEFLYAEQNENVEPEKKLRRMIRGMAHISKMRPLHSIVLRELFSGGKNLPDSLRKNIDHYLEKFSLICDELREHRGSVNVSTVVVAWMVFSFFQQWELAMPFVYEGNECTQLSAIEAVGKDVNEKLINEVETLVFRMLGIERQTN